VLGCARTSDPDGAHGRRNRNARTAGPRWDCVHSMGGYRSRCFWRRRSIEHINGRGSITVFPPGLGELGISREPYLVIVNSLKGPRDALIPL